MQYLQTKENCFYPVFTVLLLLPFCFSGFYISLFWKEKLYLWANNINNFMLKSLKRAVVLGLFFRSHFKLLDQIKEYLIKRNRPVMFSYYQFKTGSGIRDRVWTTYENDKVAYHGSHLNAVSTTMAWVRFPQLTISKISKTSKRCWILKVVCSDRT